MTIHSDHPFLPSEEDRDPVRRFRGRLGAAVTLWTSGAAGYDRAGLTVSSLMVANGDPARVLALLDPDHDLTERLAGTGTATVHVLAAEHRELADVFADLMPSPGGPWRAGDFTDTPDGPRLAGVPAWARVRLEDARDVGWSRLVTCVVDEVGIGDDAEPLLHRRGRYLR